MFLSKDSGGGGKRSFDGALVRRGDVCRVSEIMGVVVDDSLSPSARYHKFVANFAVARV